MYEELELERTECACARCVSACRRQPGMLAPGDLKRLAETEDEEGILRFALEHLRASPGALLAIIHDGQVVPLRVPTLVPRRGDDGACHWLTPEGRCSVWEHSPAGCALFDTHMEQKEADRRSLKVLRAIGNDRTYLALWSVLHLVGLRAEPPEANVPH